MKWGKATYYASDAAGPPFWIGTGLRPTTVLFAAGLALASAAIFGVLPALRATGRAAQSQLKSLGSGGSTLRFGRVWSAAMIGQVALSVVAIPPAIGISEEGIRDPIVRSRFPSAEYLVAQFELDRDSGRTEESEAEYASRRERTYAEVERRIAQDPSVSAVTVGDPLPGMSPLFRRADVEVARGAPPVFVDTVWIANAGPGYFEAFDRPVVAGRGFTAADRLPTSNIVLVNEAFARRRFMNGASPLGSRVRYRTPEGAPGPWFEIVGIVRDFGMTPTDLGEAPYVFHPASAGTITNLVMGVRVRGDRASVAQRIRVITGEIDPRLRIADLQPLDDLAWNEVLDAVLPGVAVAAIVSLGLALSAVAIFSLTSVTVARRTREIGVRTALGASPRRMLGSIFSHAAVLVGCGILLANLPLIGFVFFFGENLPLSVAVRWTMISSAIMLVVAVLACVSPARRALRIDPTDALRQV
jgi:hypothetical protein